MEVSTISKEDYNQKISILHKTIREEKERLDEVFHKRNTFKRNYIKIFEALRQEDYITSAELYFSIAKKQLNRRDYDTTSILVLLGSLCILHSNSDRTLIHEFFNERFLQSTFSIKLLKLLLQAYSDGLKSEYLTLWSMLKVIRVFEEERNLIEKVVTIN